MNKLGLAAAGGAARGFLARSPALKVTLGPVASTSYRLARRIANGLKAGHAVREMRELGECPVILVCATGGTITQVTASLLQADFKWRKRVLLFCDSADYSCDFPEFRKLGAATGSVNSIDGGPERYAIEGDRDALREARLLVRGLGGKPVEMAAEHMRMYDAARTLAGSLFTPLIEICSECIRQTGVSGPDAAMLAETLLLRSVRAFMRSGRKSWSGPVPRLDLARIDRECLALTAVKPVMGRYFRNSADLALELYRTFPELTRYSRSDLPPD